MWNDETEHTLLPRQSEPKTKRIVATAGFYFLTVVFGAGTVFFVMRLQNRHVAQQIIPAAPVPSTFEVSQNNSRNTAVVFPDTYLGDNRQPISPPVIPKAEPLPDTVTPMPASIVQPSPFGRTAPSIQEPTRVQQVQETPPPQQGQTVQKPQKPKPDTWLFAPSNDSTKGKPPFPPEKDKDRALDKKHEEQTSKLISKADWARSTDPVHMLYRSQNVHGILRYDINSDIPGDVFIMVDRPVLDALRFQETIIPQFSELIGKYTSETKYGQTRIDVKIEEIQFPDKTLIALGKSKATDRNGAVGLTGKVNNHYFQLGMAVVLSAVLNVGASSVAGDTSGFHPTTEQRVASEIGRGVNQGGQEIVKRELTRGPTITIPAGSEVGVQFGENISFSTAPVMIGK
jgi:type IV secretory pathway VirB10-like protein